VQDWVIKLIIALSSLFGTGGIFWFIYKLIELSSKKKEKDKQRKHEITENEKQREHEKELAKNEQIANAKNLNKFLEVLQNNNDLDFDKKHPYWLKRWENYRKQNKGKNIK